MLIILIESAIEIIVITSTTLILNYLFQKQDWNTISFITVPIGALLGVYFESKSNNHSFFSSFYFQIKKPVTSFIHNFKSSYKLFKLSFGSVFMWLFQGIFANITSLLLNKICIHFIEAKILRIINFILFFILSPLASFSLHYNFAEDIFGTI